MKAYSYIRFSRPEQLRGDSLNRQLEASEKYAKDHNLTLDTSLRDLGLSAYNGAHRTKGALGSFLRLVEDGKVPPGSLLIVESLDRLSREQVLDALLQFLALLNAGIVVVTLLDDQKYSRESVQDGYGLIQSLMVMSRAHEESLSKGKRVAKAWARKRAAAASTNKPLTSRCPAWMRLVDGAYELIPDRAAIIRRIFTEIADGLGKRAVAGRLNREGIRGWGGAAWQPSYIQKILNSQAVLGIYQPHRRIEGKRQPEGEPLSGYFPPAVEESLYWRARAATKARGSWQDTKSNGRRGRTVSNLFSHIAKCVCGAPMVYLNKGQSPRGGTYLVCDHAMRGLGCERRRHWRYESTEELILRALHRLDLSRIVESGTDDDAAVEIEALRARLAASVESEQRAVDVLFGGKPTPAIAARLEALHRENEAMRTQLAALDDSYKQHVHGHATFRSRIELIESILQQMAADDLSDDDLYFLRSKVAHELKRVVRSLEFSDVNIKVIYATRDPSWGRLALPAAWGEYLIKSPAGRYSGYPADYFGQEDEEDSPLKNRRGRLIEVADRTKDVRNP